MQVENDYDKDVYNGDLGVVSRIDMEEGELVVEFEAAKSPTGLANSTSWCSLTQRRSTRARVRNTRL
jgi:ATP-dependent exoDNAse (exonuclease V) alpha subunit